MPSDPYETLGVPRSASADEIKRAYRRATLQHHPDRNAGDLAAAERFRAASEAFELLSDPARRREYDRPPAREHERDFGSASEPSSVLYDWLEATFGSEMVDEIRSASTEARRDASLLDMALGTIERLLRESNDLDPRTRSSATAFVDAAGTVTVVVPRDVAARGGIVEFPLPDRAQCLRCSGQGVHACTGCSGRGRATVVQGSMRFAGAPCPSCAGGGHVVCSPCKGSGTVVVESTGSVRIRPGTTAGTVVQLMDGHGRTRRLVINVA